MTMFPAIETYRAELRAQNFVRLEGAQLDQLRGDLREMHYSNEIEGIHPTPELAALFAMFIEERAPASAFGPFVHRWLRERLPAQKAALAA